MANTWNVLREKTYKSGCPSLSGKVAACKWIESIQECPADTPGEAVIYSFLSFTDIFAARQSHGFTSFHLTNGEHMKCAKRKDIQKWVSESPIRVFPQWVSESSNPSLRLLTVGVRVFRESSSGCPSLLPKVGVRVFRVFVRVFPSLRPFRKARSRQLAHDQMINVEKARPYGQGCGCAAVWARIGVDPGIARLGLDFAHGSHNAPSFTLLHPTFCGRDLLSK
jgi:hypothetical protein